MSREPTAGRVASMSVSLAGIAVPVVLPGRVGSFVPVADHYNALNEIALLRNRAAELESRCRNYELTIDDLVGKLGAQLDGAATAAILPSSGDPAPQSGPSIQLRALRFSHPR